MFVWLHRSNSTLSSSSNRIIPGLLYLSNKHQYPGHTITQAGNLQGTPLPHPTKPGGGWSLLRQMSHEILCSSTPIQLSPLSFSPQSGFQLFSQTQPAQSPSVLCTTAREVIQMSLFLRFNFPNMTVFLTSQLALDTSHSMWDTPLSLSLFHSHLDLKPPWPSRALGLLCPQSAQALLFDFHRCHMLLPLQVSAMVHTLEETSPNGGRYIRHFGGCCE